MARPTPGAAVLLGGPWLAAVVGAESMPSLASLDMAVPSAFAQACFSADTDLWGGDLAPPIMEPSAEACQVHCQQVARCEFFTWLTEGGKCYVKSASAGKSRIGKVGTISGPRSCQAASAGPDPSFQQMGLAKGAVGATSAGGGQPWVDVPVTLPAGGAMLGGELESMPPMPPVTTTTRRWTLPATTTPIWTLPVTSTRWTLPPTLTPEPMPTYTPQPVTTTPWFPDIVPETTTPAPIMTTTPEIITTQNDPDPDEPLMVCELNCYGESSVPVPISDVPAETATKVDSAEHCRQLCVEAQGCTAVVFQDHDVHGKACWGKKDIDTYECPSGEGDFPFLTEILTQLPIGKCAILGDPHILSFDNSHGHKEDNTELHHGHYHLVYSPALQVQGRFGYTKQFPSASSLVGIAASGVYMRGNHLALVYKGPEGVNGVAGFVATWNGRQILEGGLGSIWRSPDGVLSAECNLMDPQKFHRQARHTYGGTEGDKPSYLFKIQPDLEIYILVGDDAMNAVITMRALPGGQDGFCGNFNCDPDDDHIIHLRERSISEELGHMSLFHKHGVGIAPHYQTHPAGPVPSLETCAPEILREAEILCANDRQKHSCMLDECAKVPAQQLQAKIEEGNGLSIHGLATFVPAWLQASLGVALVGLFVLGVTVGVPARRGRHRLYDSLAVEDGVERDDSREFRLSRGFASGTGQNGEPGFFEAPLLGLRRLQSSAAQHWSRASLAPLDEETEDEALLGGHAIAGEHEPILNADLDDEETGL